MRWSVLFDHYKPIVLGTILVRELIQKLVVLLQLPEMKA